MKKKKIFVAKTAEQVKMIFDPYRLRIIKTLFESKKEMTVKQLADAIGEAPNKVHYHVKKLFDYGALELVRTENINGIIAKYYINAYGGYIIDSEGDSQEVHNLKENALMMTLDNEVNKFKKDMVAYMNLVAEHGKEAQRGLEIGYSKLYMTREEKEELFKKIHTLMKEYFKEDESKEVYTTIHTLARIK